MFLAENILRQRFLRSIHSSEYCLFRKSLLQNFVPSNQFFKVSEAKNILTKNVSSVEIFREEFSDKKFFFARNSPKRRIIPRENVSAKNAPERNFSTKNFMSKELSLAENVLAMNIPTKNVPANDFP
jgi:hypothetical protein